MKIVIEFCNPTPSHCDVTFFVNGANAGTITLRQEELAVFQDIVFHGPTKRDEVISRGDPNPPSQ